MAGPRLSAISSARGQVAGSGGHKDRHLFKARPTAPLDHSNFDNPGDRDPAGQHRRPRRAKASGQRSRDPAPRERDHCPLLVHSTLGASGGWTGPPPVEFVPVAAPTQQHHANHLPDVLRNLDLLVLLLALPVFVVVDAPLVGYLVAGGAWLLGRVWIEYAARRRAPRSPPAIAAPPSA